MVIVMEKNAPNEALERVLSEIKSLGFTPHISQGESRTLIGAIGPAPTTDIREHLRGFNFVDNVLAITKPFKLASREFRHDDSEVMIGGETTGGVATGNGRFTVAAGPCSVESLAQIRAQHISLKSTARASCAAARSNRGRALTPFRAWVRRAWRF